MRFSTLAMLAWAAVGCIAAPAAADDGWAEPRARMVGTIVEYGRRSEPVVEGGVFAPIILETMKSVPRHEFVPLVLRPVAYYDRPLPIGYGQTISQPFIVALMTYLLAPEPDHVVLEVGTGSGYQAAVLSPLVGQVCSIEIIAELGRAAADRLQRLGYANVETRIGDGYYGWPECGPFDGIVVTAAAGHIPPPLVDQLKPGGKMVIPVGGPFSTQQLVLVENRDEGRITTRQLLPVRFVPLTGDHP